MEITIEELIRGSGVDLDDALFMPLNEVKKRYNRNTKIKELSEYRKYENKFYVEIGEYNFIMIHEIDEVMELSNNSIESFITYRGTNAYTSLDSDIEFEEGDDLYIAIHILENNLIEISGDEYYKIRSEMIELSTQKENLIKRLKKYSK